MKLNEFVQGNSDEELMKSLYQTCVDSGKEPSEDLLKAMDKAGLVQVQRTVNGKHGTYTRMQWVKTSDVKDSDRVVGGKKPEGDSGNKYSEQERKQMVKLFSKYMHEKYGDKKVPPEKIKEEVEEFKKKFKNENSTSSHTTKESNEKEVKDSNKAKDSSRSSEKQTELSEDKKLSIIKEHLVNHDDSYDIFGDFDYDTDENGYIMVTVGDQLYYESGEEDENGNALFWTPNCTKEELQEASDNEELLDKYFEGDKKVSVDKVAAHMLKVNGKNWDFNELD